MLRNRDCLLRSAWFVLALAVSSVALAEDPVLVVFIKSADALLNDAKYVLSTGGTEGDLVDGLIDQVTQGKGLAGVDKSKPLGAYMTINAAGNQDFVLFVPVNDNKAFRDLLSTIGFSRQQEVAGGLFSIQAEGQQFYGRFSNGYCFLTLLPGALNQLPDPKKIASTRYTLGMEANLAKVSDEIKADIIDALDSVIAEADEENKPENEIESRMRGRFFKTSTEFVRLLVNNTERLSLGLDVDQKAKLFAVDMTVVAKEGSPLAESLATYAKITPAFASLIGPDSVASFTFAMPVSEGLRGLLRDGVRSSLEEARTDIDKSEKLSADEKKALKELTVRIVKVFDATGDLGKIDMAVTLNSTNGKPQVVGAVQIAEGDELGKIIDDTLKQAGRALPDMVKLDVAKHNGARIHSISPELEGEAKDLFGSSPLCVAVRNDAIYFAIGGDSLAAIKSAIDKTGKGAGNRPPVSARVQPSKVVELLGGAAGDDPNVDLARQAFTGEGDHLSLELLPIPNGARLRLELGEGFLRFIALIVNQQLGG